MVSEFALWGFILARVDLSVCIKPEMLDEAAAGLALAGRIVDRQIDEVGLRVERRSAERRLRGDILRPDRVEDRLEDRQRQPRPGLGRTERTPTACFAGRHHGAAGRSVSSSIQRIGVREDIGFGDLRAEQEDLARIVDPEQKKGHDGRDGQRPHFAARPLSSR